MKRLPYIAMVLALTMAKPEVYREKEDFQYSRSSSDEGTKSGYYGAQRGNMGGNYERAHNMDGLAQHQMSGLVRQVQGELGDGTKMRTGSVYSAANSRGIYGSGNYDLSNLEGRNFQEGVSFGDSQSQSSSSAASHNSAYREQSSSNANSEYRSSRFHNSRYNGYQNGQYSGLSSDNYKPVGNLQTVDEYQPFAQGGQSSGHVSQAAYEGHTIYDQSSSQRAREYEARRHESQNSRYFSQSDLQDQSAYDHSNGNSRIISGQPVRIRVRPGATVIIPVNAQALDSIGSASSVNQHAINSEAEVLANSDQQVAYRPTSNAKHYESSYSYRKEWEKHHGQLVPEATLTPTTENPFPKNSELYDDSQLLQTDNAHSDLYKGSARYSGVNSKSAASRYQSDFNAQHRSASSSASANRLSHGAFNTVADVDASSIAGDINSKPRSYQSSYSYHKSWERQGDPYIIRPSSNGLYDGQIAERLTSGSNSQRSSNQYGSHQSYSQNTAADCDEHGHVRVARSYGSRPYQRANNEAEVGQQVQNSWQNLEDLGQQTQNQWENYGQQTQNQWEQYGQQTQKQWEDLGQQTQNQWENLGQQTQNKWDNLGSHKQYVGEPTQDTREFEHQPHISNDFGQQTQNQWNNFEDQKDIHEHTDISQSSHFSKPGIWDKVNTFDVFQHSQNKDFGHKQTGPEVEREEVEKSEQSPFNWHQVEDFSQNPKNVPNSEDMLQENDKSNPFWDQSLGSTTPRDNEQTIYNTAHLTPGWSGWNHGHHLWSHHAHNHFYRQGQSFYRNEDPNKYSFYQRPQIYWHGHSMDNNNFYSQQKPQFWSFLDKIDNSYKPSSTGDNTNRETLSPGLYHTQTHHSEINWNTQHNFGTEQNNFGYQYTSENPRILTTTEKKVIPTLIINENPTTQKANENELRPQDIGRGDIGPEESFDVISTTTTTQKSNIYDNSMNPTTFELNQNSKQYKTPDEIETLSLVKEDESSITIKQESNYREPSTNISTENFTDDSRNSHPTNRPINKITKPNTVALPNDQVDQYDQQFLGLDQQNQQNLSETVEIEQQNVQPNPLNIGNDDQVEHVIDFGQQPQDIYHDKQQSIEEDQVIEQQTNPLQQHKPYDKESIDNELNHKLKNDRLQPGIQNQNDFENLNLEQQNQGFEQQNQDFEQQNQGFEQQNQDFEQQNQRFEQQNQDFEQQNQAFEQQNQDFEQQNQGFEQQNQDLGQQIQVFEQKNQELEQQNQGFEQQNQDIEQQNQGFEQQNQDLGQQIQVFEQKNQELEQQNQGFEQQNQELEQQNQGFEQQNQDFEQQNQGFEQKNQELEQQTQGFDQHNQDFEQQNQGFEQQNQKLEQQNQGFEQQNQAFEQQNEGFEQQNEGIEQQNQAFEQQNQGFEEQNPASELLTQGIEQQSQGFEQQNEGFDQQNPTSEQLTQGIEPQKHQFEEHNQNFGQQNIDGLEDFEQQNENLFQENKPDEEQNLSQKVGNLDQQGLNLDQQNQEFDTENIDLGDFGQKKNQLSEQDQEAAFEHNGQEIQSPWEPQENLEQFSKQSQIEPFKHSESQKQNIGEPQENLELFHEPEISKVETSLTHKKPANLNDVQTNQNEKDSKIEIPPELITEKPGFWNKVGSKLKSAKNSVVSWFKSR